MNVENDMEKQPLIRLEDVSFSFGREPVLDRISLEIGEGEYLGVIGPNGGGKTTLLRLMLGLIQPASGSVSLFGQPVNAFRDWSKIGYIPQKATHIESRFPYTVEEVVQLGRISRVGVLRRFKAADKKSIAEALELVDMLPYRKHLVTELSGGQQQRVFIAKGLVSDPAVLILDEPTVGVDLKSQDEFYRLLSRLNREHRMTLVVVSHDVDVIANEVGSLACVNQTLIYHGEPKEFIKGDYLENLYGQGRKFILHGH
ncbi:MAG: metal ABC transporter ATP-binding protein [Actinobacteria bacterium]|nr:metal ABC transporter ATP-binding protein [Actinomycetota bacterium]